MRKASVLLFSFLLLTSMKAVVLDTDGKSIAVVDAATGTVIQRLMLSDTPRQMIVSPDGKRIAVLSRGEGSESFWTGRFTPKTKSSVTLVDAATLKQVARTELGWGLGRAAFSRDSATLTVLTPGVSSNKPAEAKAAELIRVDTRTGEVAKRMPLDRAAESLDVSSDGTTGAIFFKGSQEKPAEVRLIDLATLGGPTTILLSKNADLAVALINDSLYFADSAKTKSGKIYVVSLADKKLAATIDAGDRPTIASVDPDRGVIYVVNGNDELRMIGGTSAVATVKVARNPVAVRFSEDKKLAYVISFADVTVVDLTRQSAGVPIHTRGEASDFVASSDGRRGFVLHGSDQSCCAATVLDLTSGTNMKSFMTGSKGARIGQALLAGAATIASYQSGRSAALAHGGGTFTYTVYTPRASAVARGPIAIRRDGKFAYVLDTQTNDVTVIDGESGERLQNIRVGSGGKELVPLANGRYLAAVTDASVTLIDTESNSLKSEVKLSGDVQDFILSPHGDYATVMGKEKIAVIDTNTASQVATFDVFKKPTQFVFFGE